MLCLSRIHTLQEIQSVGIDNVLNGQGFVIVGRITVTGDVPPLSGRLCRESLRPGWPRMCENVGFR